MKSKFFAIALVVATLFASCTKEEQVGVVETQLTIRLSGAISSRAIGEPGKSEAGTIELTNGYIFVINTSDIVLDFVALDVEEVVKTTGQEFPRKVSANSKVYIIANIPAGVTVVPADFKTLKELQNFSAAITTQDDYTKAALSNVANLVSGDAVAITANTVAQTATVNIQINPAISRLELAQVTGSGNIKSFDVTGVFVDDYHTVFTWGGDKAGAIYEHKQGLDFSGYNTHFFDAGTWSSDNLVSVPAADLSWVYNLPAKGLPRFIIRLENVVAEAGFNGVDPTKTYFLTVTGYDNVTAFERGKIYRIGGEKGVTFDETHLEDIPNPIGVDLTVTIEIKEWEIATPGATLTR